jgi:hypothetical protein
VILKLWIVKDRLRILKEETALGVAVADFHLIAFAMVHQQIRRAAAFDLPPLKTK